MTLLRRFLGTGRARWVALAVTLLGVLAFSLTREGGPSAPVDLEKLEEAGRAGAEAQEHSARITENLNEIAENLEAGGRLTETSSEIHELTEQQRASLTDLADLLRRQLDSIRRTGRHLAQSERSALGVERIGERERRRITGTLESLRRLERATLAAVTRSANLARQAVYGARLAEDSADAFGRP